MIDAAAADWVARLDRAPADPVLGDELAAWLAADPRRRGAMLRAQAAWALLGDREPAHSATPDRRRLLMAGGAIAASLVFGIGAWVALDRDATFATQVGERRNARLADGSMMLLNTRSASRVAITDTARRVTLDEGEAWFQVAKDRHRPFVVIAGAVRAEAVGTAFSVRKLADRAEVAVSEGRVRVWSTTNPSRFLILTAGQHATVDDLSGATAAAVTTGGIERTLAWRRGEIVLDGMTLGDAAAEFNRYNRRQMAVEASLADRRLVGWFRTDDLDGFAKSAAAMTDARIEQDDGRLRLAPR